jgi:exonuclease III
MSLLASCFIWNVWELNGRAHRNVIREFLVQERATLVCIQETKLSTVCNSLAIEILGPAFDYDYPL